MCFHAHGLGTSTALVGAADRGRLAGIGLCAGHGLGRFYRRRLHARRIIRRGTGPQRGSGGENENGRRDGEQGSDGFHFSEG